MTWMPLELRLDYGYALTGFTAVALTSAALPFVNIVTMLPSVVWDRGGTHEPYTPREVPEMTRRLGLMRAPKVLLVTNPRFAGPFTNALTCTVRLPKSWLAKFPHSEILSTLGHEFGHIRARRRFWLEMIGAFGIVFVTAVPLAFLTVPLIAQIFEVAFLLLMITRVSWRNEYRADLKSAKALGPEGLISVLEQLESESGRDEGSETHPPIRERIERLSRLLGPD